MGIWNGYLKTYVYKFTYKVKNILIKHKEYVIIDLP